MSTPHHQEISSAKQTLDTQQSRRILDFWRKVEFFIPYDLQGQILEHQDKAWAVRLFTQEQWASIGLQSRGDLWRKSGIPEGKQLHGFELFLGIFDKSLLSDVVKKTLTYAASETEITEDTERGDLEGLTCFARILLNKFGEPRMDKVSVSTVPWALGRLRSVGIKGLDSDAYQVSIQSLKHELENFKNITRAKSVKENTAITSSSLVRADIDLLRKILYAWAGFEPEGDDLPVVIIRTIAHSGSQGTEDASNANAEDEPKDDDPDLSMEDEIGILNSFYVQDIQRILGALPRQRARSPLIDYLTPLPEAARIDLYTDPGREKIRAMLHPSKMPSGRWLSQPDQAMSLMQQFAINQICETLKEGGIFSVNGPPGTGKTTMLRDIFAENITRRARVLAGLKSSSEAFKSGPKITVEIQKNKKITTWSIAPLIPKLTGFEMLVVSSNNAAVKNISEDLPKTSSLGKLKNNQAEDSAWRHPNGSPKITYLQQVAIKHAARNNKGAFDSLSSDNSPWGLISCALGNKTNREFFVTNAFAENFESKDGESVPEGFDPRLHQTLWQWRDCYSGPTFAEARRKFQDAEKKLKEWQDELARYVDAIEEINGLSREAFVEDVVQDVLAAELVWKQSQALLDAAESELANTIKIINEQGLKSAGIKARNNKLLSWLFRFFSSVGDSVDGSPNEWGGKTISFRKIELELDIVNFRNSAESARKRLKELVKEKDGRINKWNSNKAIIENCKGKFLSVSYPLSLSTLETDDCQKDGLWLDFEISQLRSELFAAALGLHEAWLGEVLQKRGSFGANLGAISAFLNGGWLRAPEHALPIWQSLFMVVPVVSSTFASIGRQFDELGPKSLGWLFIDEAGQAVPQAVVGALWRTKRAVVVGDPLQIEPVFTVPVKLIDALAKHSGVTKDDQVLPHKCSVQNLADLANRLGTSISDASQEKKWIGSPLRVHRRCSNPMFEIANAIAYQGKMIFGGSNGGVPSPESIDLGCSAWVDTPGRTSDKQVVPTQIDMVVKALVTLYTAVGELPPVYIISPFKRIASKLKSDLSDTRLWGRLATGSCTLPSAITLRRWCKGHVGTVHTFQGKQASIVWLVLGCDETTKGAVSWASSKPNILNVAMTRAEDRIFIVGEAALWGGQQFFTHATSDLLPRISADEFISRMVVAGYSAQKNSPAP